MDMKKMIDQFDFEDFNASKRWKKDPKQSHQSLADSRHSNQSKENVLFEANCNEPKESSLQPSKHEANSKQELNQKKRSVMPQVIDEDTEHFRNSLQHLLNTFKTDAVSEFMSMKKSMIDYQKETIKGDTQKYLSMYEEKHQQLLQAKEQLISLTDSNEKKTMQIDLMSNHIAKLNQRVRITKYLSRPFSILFQNKERQQMLKFKMREAESYNSKRLKNKSVNGWRNLMREHKKEVEKEAMEKQVEMQVSDIVNKFQKEIEMLREKLSEATRQNQQHQNNKHMVQENLKKAFLKGISTMNMEAMGVLGGQHEPEEDHSKNEFLQNMSCTEQSMGLSRSKNPMSQTTINATTNASVMVNRTKVESKDHKWRQAPVLGVQEKREAEQPRPQLIKPTAEGKVIKIFDGKSSVEASSSKQIGRKAAYNSTAYKGQSSRRK